MCVRAEAINRYMCGFRVYVGKQGNNTEMGLGGNIVMELHMQLWEKSIPLHVKTKGQIKCPFNIIEHNKYTRRC